MPRFYRKKRAGAKRTVARRRAGRRGYKARIPRSMNSPSIFHFKRTASELVQIGVESTGVPGMTPWNLNDSSTTFGRTFEFKLNQLNDHSDFENLFAYYKINAVAVKIWPSATHTQENAIAYANQVLMRWDNNWTQLSLGNNNVNNYMDSQTSKVRRLINAGGNPIKLYMKMRQSQLLIQGGNVVNTTGVALKHPAWISTSDDEISHYGMNLCFHRVDGSSLVAPAGQKLRFEYTFYLSCKKVI
jgi:hypothetical protein